MRVLPLVLPGSYISPRLHAECAEQQCQSNSCTATADELGTRHSAPVPNDPAASDSRIDGAEAEAATARHRALSDFDEAVQMESTALGILIEPGADPNRCAGARAYVRTLLHTLVEQLASATTGPPVGVPEVLTPSHDSSPSPKLPQQVLPSFPPPFPCQLSPTLPAISPTLPAISFAST